MNWIRFTRRRHHHLLILCNFQLLLSLYFSSRVRKYRINGNDICISSHFIWSNRNILLFRRALVGFCVISLQSEKKSENAFTRTHSPKPIDSIISRFVVQSHGIHKKANRNIRFYPDFNFIIFPFSIQWIRRWNRDEIPWMNFECDGFIWAWKRCEQTRTTASYFFTHNKRLK